MQVMEDMSEYLLNPCRLVLKPEYMYVDVEKRQIYFCYLPGYDEDVRQKFQELTEYILPILDHEDSKAVMLGYGIYRRALEDSFHLEYIKKELYQDREEIEKTVGSSILQESGTMTEKRCNSDGSEKIDLFENYGESKEEKPQEEHLEELLWEEELSEKKKKDVGGTSKGFLFVCSSWIFCTGGCGRRNTGVSAEGIYAGYSGSGSWDYGNWNVVYLGCVRYKE